MAQEASVAEKDKCFGDRFMCEGADDRHVVVLYNALQASGAPDRHNQCNANGDA